MDDELPPPEADVVAFVLGPTERRPAPGERPRPVLEVHHLWGTVLLDTKQFAPGSGRDVTIGARAAHRWQFLGVDMGFVPAPLGWVLPLFAPGWSDVALQRRSDFLVPPADLPEDEDWALFQPDPAGEGFVARVPDGWRGLAEVGGERVPLEDLAARGLGRIDADGSVAVPITGDLRLVIERGNSAFVAQVSQASRRIVVRAAEELDYGFLALMAAAAVLFFAVGAVTLLAGDVPSQHEGIGLTDGVVEVLLAPTPDPGPAGAGAQARDEEGAAPPEPEPEVTKVETDPAVAKRAADIEVVRNAGLAGALEDDAELAAVLGQAGLSVALQDGVGGLIGTHGTAPGGTGLGSRGGGIGGGGTAEGLGGGLGTKGLGAGDRGYGAGGGGTKKAVGAIRAVGGDPIVLGALDRSLIDEVVKRQMDQIRYCYQRELTRNPALAGKLVVKFTIAGDGSVSQAGPKTSTLGSGSVENCVTGRFLRMRFPAPAGGGIVVVSYPFLFSPG